MELSDEDVAILNDCFSDILTQDQIRKSTALPAELGDGTEALPRLVLYFNQRSVGRLYQMLEQINHMGSLKPEQIHPEHK